MEYTFVAQPHTRGAKRRQVESACDFCKKRKKRCRHRTPKWEPLVDPSRDAQAQEAPDSNDSERQLEVPLDVSTLNTTNPGSNSANLKRSAHGASSANDGPPSRTKRFVGNLNPEAFLANAGAQRSELHHDQDRVGIWVDSADDDDGSGEVEEQLARPGLEKGLRDSALETQSNGLQKSTYQGFAPLKEDQDALLDIYFSSVHPILPIVNEVDFRNLYAAGNAPTALVQAMCLVAGKAERARPFLRVSGDAAAGTYRYYARRLYSSLSRSMETAEKRDKVLFIQVCSLCSLYSEGFNGLEESSMQLAKAVHYVHSLGLHLGRSQAEHQQEHLRHLFWCLWSLDRLSAAVNGRPIMLHERDIGQDMHPDPTACSPTFRIWLKIIGLLDQIICFYRPSADPSVTGWETEFPSFEEIVDEAHGWLIGRKLLSSLEVLYHAIAILSHRSRSSDEGLLSKPSSIRQRFSAMQIVSMLDLQTFEELTPLPFVPYAFSLALSVAYRQQRQARCSLHSERATAALKRCCHVLNKMGRVWRTANAVAKVGAGALASLREVPRDVGQSTTEPGVIEAPENTREPYTSSNETRVTNMTEPIAAEPTLSAPRPDESLSQIVFPGQIEDIDALLGGILDLNIPSNFEGPFSEELFSYCDIFDDHTNPNTGFL